MAHRSITFERVEAAVSDSMFGLGNDGFCLSCGEQTGGCEPDARNYKCPACGKRNVYGAQEVLLMGAFHEG